VLDLVLEMLREEQRTELQELSRLLLGNMLKRCGTVDQKPVIGFR
jgi:hypothetical protein